MTVKTRTAPVQTTLHYTVNGDTVTVVRWDIDNSAEASDAIRAEYRALSDDGYAHIRQDVIFDTDDAKRHTERGANFFAPEAMRFFNARIGRERLVNGGLYFVTSEKDWDGARRYSVRLFKDGEIDYAEGTEFQAFDTGAKANRFLDSL